MADGDNAALHFPAFSIAFGLHHGQAVNGRFFNGFQNLAYFCKFTTGHPPKDVR